MPDDTRFGVFEIGMNHPGEISPLSQMVVPDVAIITTVAPVHLGQFDSVAQIADAKAEIFDGLPAGGRALINRDNPYFQQLRDRADAAAAGAEVMSFGHHESADVRLVSLKSDAQGSLAQIDVMGEPVTLRLNAPGAHLVQNALAVLGAVKLVGCCLTQAAEALAEFEVPEGRGVATRLPCDGGQVVLIDESYNANPASMAAAIAVAGLNRDGVSRRIAVLGDMLELGEQGPQMHRDLRAPLVAAGIDLVFACGPMMRGLYDDLPGAMQGVYAETPEGLEAPLVARVRAGDLVMIKGSLGSRMQPLVAALKTHLSKND